jgi:hypothetical protein
MSKEKGSCTVFTHKVKIFQNGNINLWIICEHKTNEMMMLYIIV